MKVLALYRFHSARQRYLLLAFCQALCLAERILAGREKSRRMRKEMTTATLLQMTHRRSRRSVRVKGRRRLFLRHRAHALAARVVLQLLLQLPGERARRWREAGGVERQDESGPSG